MREYGVWSTSGGGFVSAGAWSAQEAEGHRDRLIAEGDEPGDLAVLAICGDHEDQPARGCEVCEEALYG